MPKLGYCLKFYGKEMQCFSPCCLKRIMEFLFHILLISIMYLCLVFQGFFHRCTRGKEKLYCNADGKCPVLYTMQKICKMCRYYKCITVGMAKQGKFCFLQVIIQVRAIFSKIFFFFLEVRPQFCVLGESSFIKLT